MEVENHRFSRGKQSSKRPCSTSMFVGGSVTLSFPNNCCLRLLEVVLLRILDDKNQVNKTLWVKSPGLAESHPFCVTTPWSFCGSIRHYVFKSFCTYCNLLPICKKNNLCSFWGGRNPMRMHVWCRKTGYIPPTDVASYTRRATHRTHDGRPVDRLNEGLSTVKRIQARTCWLGTA